jgi:hypothetical protein
MIALPTPSLLALLLQADRCLFLLLDGGQMSRPQPSPWHPFPAAFHLCEGVV